MTEIQLSSGSSSSATHRITQPSHTLNRRYVERPTTLAVEEAARSAHTTNRQTSSAPSRLVNLRVHAADLVKATAEPEQPATPPTATTIVPKVIELGSDATEAETAPAAPLDLTQIVPPEDTSNEVVNLPQAMPIAETTTLPAAYTQPVAAALPATVDDPESLVMNIAADYAAASIGVSANSPVASGSVDTVANIVSEAIAAIRTATDPEEIAKQIASLQDFANTIKATSAAPEMIELSDTIEKFLSVAMKSTGVQEEVKKQAKAKTATKTKVEAKSATKPATKKTTPARPTTVKRPTATRSTTSRTTPKTVARPSAARRATRTAAKPKLAADNDQALRKALRSVAAMDDEPTTATKSARKPVIKRKSSGKRLVLAFFCAAICVAAVVYFVGTNIPDISVKVAAMQTGIEASYPAYIPRDYSLNDISSEEGKITLTFKGPERATFTLTEEKSSWDSNTLLRNYVEPTWESNYITTHEQGITIYISGTNAAWVNGGVLYKITATGNNLTKKQLRNIVISM